MGDLPGVGFARPGDAHALRNRPTWMSAWVHHLNSPWLLLAGFAAIASLGITIEALGGDGIATMFVTLTAVFTVGAVALSPSPWRLLAILGGSYAVLAALAVVGGTATHWAGALTWMLLLSTATIIAARALHYQPHGLTLVLAVLLISEFAAGALIGMSWTLAALALATTTFTVLAAVVAPHLRWWLLAVIARPRLSTFTRRPRRITARTKARPPADLSTDPRVIHAAHQEVADILRGLPDTFHVLHSVHARDGVDPVAHLVFAPHGAYVIAVTPVLDSAFAEAAVRGEGIGVDYGTEMARLARQRAEVIRRLNLPEDEVMAVWVVSAADGHDPAARGLLAGRPAGSDISGVRVRIVTPMHLRAVIDDPLSSGRRIDAHVKAAKAAAVLSPARGFHPTPEPLEPFQVGRVDADGNTRWLPHITLPATARHWNIGDHVYVMTPAGPHHGLRLVGLPHRDNGFMTVQVCNAADYDAVMAHLSRDVTTLPATAIAPASPAHA